MTECNQTKFSPMVCEHGTKGCTVNHDKLSRSPACSTSPQEQIEAMANLWVSFGQEFDTFLMCSPSIADCIKEKT